MRQRVSGSRTRAELACRGSAALTFPSACRRLGSGLLSAAVRAEVTGHHIAARALPARHIGAVRRLLRRLLLSLLLLLLTHGEQVLGVHAAACVHSHAHAHKAGHCACLVAGRGLHGVRLSADKSCRRHGGIAHDSCTLSLLDELRILFGEGDRAEGYCDDLESAQLAPLCGEGGVHSGFKLGVVSHYLIGAKLKVGELSKSGLKRADELCLELIVYLFAGIILLGMGSSIL